MFGRKQREQKARRGVVLAVDNKYLRKGNFAEDILVVLAGLLRPTGGSK